MKSVKYIRYFKFATAIILFALLFGKIWYEYGYEHGIETAYGYESPRNGFVRSIESIYVWAVYALIYLVICICQGRGETSLGTNIFSTVFLGIPFIAILVINIIYASTAGVTDILALVVFGITFVLEVVILVLYIRQNVILGKKFNSMSSN